MTFNMGEMVKARSEETQSFWEWCITDAGRTKIGQHVILWGTCAITAVTFSWNVFFVDVVQRKYEDLSKGDVRENIRFTERQKNAVSSEFLRLFSICQPRAEVEDFTMSQIDLFYTTSLDPWSLGYGQGKVGAVLGLPSYMMEDHLDLANMRVRPFYNYFHKGYMLPDNLCDEAKEDLKKTLVLTPEERKFVMSRELAKVNSYAAVRDTALAPILFISHYMFAHHMNTRTRMITAGRSVRWPVQAGLGAAMVVIFLMTKELMTYETEANAIMTVCTTKEQASVAEGFYQKMLDRNKVLRQILGSPGDGDYNFTEEGEYQPMIYESSILNSFQVKLKLCKTLASELN